MSHIIKNLAEEFRGEYIEKNWVGQFVKYYSIRLKSLYLHNIDNLCASAEYALMFQLFFSVVNCFFAIISCAYCLNTTNVYPVSLASYGN